SPWGQVSNAFGVAVGKTAVLEWPYWSRRDVAQSGSALAWGVQNGYLPQLAIINFPCIYWLFRTSAFACFSPDMPQRTNGVSNGSIKNCPNENQKKVYSGE